MTTVSQDVDTVDSGTGAVDEVATVIAPAVKVAAGGASEAMATDTLMAAVIALSATTPKIPDGTGGTGAADVKSRADGREIWLTGTTGTL